MIDQRRASAARPEGTGRATLEDLYRQIQAGQTKELRLIIKADVQGSLGAIHHAVEQVATDEVHINILREGTGDITDNDVLLASASERHHRRLQHEARSARPAAPPRPKASTSACTTSSTS